MNYKQIKHSRNYLIQKIYSLLNSDDNLIVFNLLSVCVSIQYLKSLKETLVFQTVRGNSVKQTPMKSAQPGDS